MKGVVLEDKMLDRKIHNFLKRKNESLGIKHSKQSRNLEYDFYKDKLAYQL